MPAPSFPRRRLRSRAVPLVLTGMAALALSACEEDPTVQAQAFPDLASYLDEADEADAPFTAQDCETAFAAAQAAHLESAPRYEDEALCEEQHGGECMVEVGPNGPVFMPILTGYLLARALSGNSRPLLSQPLVSRPGGFATVSGDTRLSSNSGAAEMRTSAFRPAPSTRLAPPLSRAALARRGASDRPAPPSAAGAWRGEAQVLPARTCSATTERLLRPGSPEDPRWRPTGTRQSRGG